MEPATTLRVEIWSDLVCPWCYLGRARFAAALATFDHRGAVTVAHRAFELDPATPPGETTTLLEHLTERFGSAERVLAGEQRLTELTGEVGLGYRVDRLHGNTFDAHRLVQLGVERDRGDETLAALYSSAYADLVREDEALAARLGIRGVPFFVLDRAYGISGAQPIETLTTVLDQVWAEVHAGGPA